MVGIASCIQVVFVFLGDVWHQHVHQSLHCMVERCRETLVPGELGDPKNQKEEEGYSWMEALEVEKGKK